TQHWHHIPYKAHWRHLRTRHHHMEPSLFASGPNSYVGFTFGFGSNFPAVDLNNTGFALETCFRGKVYLLSLFGLTPDQHSTRVSAILQREVARFHRQGTQGGQWRLGWGRCPLRPGKGHGQTLMRKSRKKPDQD